MTRSARRHAEAVLVPVLARASPNFLGEIAARLRAAGIVEAVARRDSAVIFDWLMTLVPLQGISDRAASAYLARHGVVTWAEVSAALDRAPSCPHLWSYWHFYGCGYRKAAGTCAEPRHFSACPLPRHNLRKGTLNQASYHLTLFIRDVCDGDFVGWLDARLADLDFVGAPVLGGLGRPTAAPPPLQALQSALLAPLSGVVGIGPKVWSMALADLLLAGDPARSRWIAAGSEMIAVDSLVHGWLHRTGILRRCQAEHPYGSACYGPRGCATVIGEVAGHVDARAYNPAFPARFPRWVQAAFWAFCAADGWDLCNGNRIDDRQRCENRACPAYRACDRLSLLRDHAGLRSALETIKVG